MGRKQNKKLEAKLWMLTGVNKLTNQREQCSMVSDRQTIEIIKASIDKQPSKRKSPYRNIGIEPYIQDIFNSKHL